MLKVQSSFFGLNIYAHSFLRFYLRSILLTLSRFQVVVGQVGLALRVKGCWLRNSGLLLLDELHLALASILKLDGDAMCEFCVQLSLVQLESAKIRNILSVDVLSPHDYTGHLVKAVHRLLQLDSGLLVDRRQFRLGALN